MKFDSPEYQTAYELYRLQEKHDRLSCSMTARDALELTKTQAERLGLPESAWQHIEREKKLQEQVENAKRFGIAKSAWSKIQLHTELQDQQNKAWGLGQMASCADDQTRALILGTIPNHLKEAFHRAGAEQPTMMEYTPPPIPNLNVGRNLQRKQVEIAEKHLETAQQAQRDAERRESESARHAQGALEEARLQRRIARISVYIAFAAFLGWATTYLYDKL